jgi:hypothetical protein
MARQAAPWRHAARGGQYYAPLNVMHILSIELTCKLDAFGIICHRDHLLSPGADMLPRAVKMAAAEIY